MKYEKEFEAHTKCAVCSQYGCATLIAVPILDVDGGDTYKVTVCPCGHAFIEIFD